MILLKLKIVHDIIYRYIHIVSLDDKFRPYIFIMAFQHSMYLLIRYSEENDRDYKSHETEDI